PGTSCRRSWPPDRSRNRHVARVPVAPGTRAIPFPALPRPAGPLGGRRPDAPAVRGGLPARGPAGPVVPRVRVILIGPCVDDTERDSVPWPGESSRGEDEV